MRKGRLIARSISHNGKIPVRNGQYLRVKNNSINCIVHYGFDENDVPIMLRPGEEQNYPPLPNGMTYNQDVHVSFGSGGGSKGVEVTFVNELIQEKVS